MHLSPSRAVTAAVFAVSLAAGAAACGSTAGGGSASSPASGQTASPTPSKDPLAGLGSGKILNEAIADTKAAPSARVKVAVNSSGSKLSLDFTIIRGQGCQGVMTQQGTARTIYDGKTGWIDGDANFWKANGGGDPRVVSLFAGKYLKTTDKEFLSDFTAFCDLGHMLSSLPSAPPGNEPESRTTVDGQPAIEFKDPTGSVVVSDSARPLLLGGTDVKDATTVSLGDYGAATRLTLPPPGDVIDGSKYGV